MYSSPTNNHEILFVDPVDGQLALQKSSFKVGFKKIF